MDSIKRFYRNVLRYSDASHAVSAYSALSPSSLELFPKIELESRLTVSRYGEFQLTEAICPSFDLSIIPTEGYCYDLFSDANRHYSMPRFIASVSRERLFETFISLLDPLGCRVDVLVETSHFCAGGNHHDHYRAEMDLPILKRSLFEYQDLLLHDGCTGIAVINPRVPLEIYFDEHKMLFIYGMNLHPFEHIFQAHGIAFKENMRFLPETRHIHQTRDEHIRGARELCSRLNLQRTK